MTTINNIINEKKKRPVRVLQFGEGNFLRAFADYMIDVANEKGVYDGSIAIVQPIDAPLLPFFEKQNSVYTVLLRGKSDGNTVNSGRIVTSVDRVISAYRDYEEFMGYARLDTLEAIISNTTEAGIAYDGDDRFDMTPPRSYPGKLTKFLYERYAYFGGDGNKGVTVYPVELIEDNGKCLKACVLKLAALWKLGDGFTDWVNSACMFASTLVDRIVTGYPRKPGEADAICEELGYKDDLIDICEPFGLWVIEAEDTERAERTLPLDRAGLPVVFTNDQRPYRERKVRVLNGAHTSFVPAAFLAGENIVRDSMADGLIRRFVDRVVYTEIVPTVPLPHNEVKAFADSVTERFENPFIDHELISICLNSVSKWKVRVLPCLKDSLGMTGKLPPCLTMSFAALCEFYSRGRDVDGGFFGERNGEDYPIKDSDGVIGFFREAGKREDVVSVFASKTEFWGEDLTRIDGFEDAVKKYHGIIRRDGITAAMEYALGEND